MVKIYGREAELEKVRADEQALREAMKQFVALHGFTNRDQLAPRVQVQAPAQQPAGAAAAPEGKTAETAQAA